MTTKDTKGTGRTPGRDPRARGDSGLRLTPAAHAADMERLELGAAGDDARAVHPSSDGSRRSRPAVGDGLALAISAFGCPWPVAVLRSGGCPWPVVVLVVVAVLWAADRRHARASRLAGRPQESRDRLLQDLAREGGSRAVLRILEQGTEATRRRGRR